MKTIYKYPLRIDDEQVVSMPSGAEILSVQVQHGMPCIWAAVDTTHEPQERRIYVRGTGHRMTGAEGRHIGTFQMLEGGLVFHAFDQRS